MFKEHLSWFATEIIYILIKDDEQSKPNVLYGLSSSMTMRFGM